MQIQWNAFINIHTDFGFRILYTCRSSTHCAEIRHIEWEREPKLLCLKVSIMVWSSFTSHAIFSLSFFIYVVFFSSYKSYALCSVLLIIWSLHCHDIHYFLSRRECVFYMQNVFSVEIPFAKYSTLEYLYPKRKSPNDLSKPTGNSGSEWKKNPPQQQHQ